MILKRVLGISLSVCILFSLCACEKNPVSNNNTSEITEPPSFISVMLGDKNIEEWNENNVICNAFWDNLKLSEEDEANFPKLKKTFDKLNNESQMNAKSQLYELSKVAKDLSGDEYNPLYLKDKSKVYLQRADTRIVSFLKETVTGSGGAQPEYTYTAYNFNPETGDAIKLSEVITSNRGLPDLVEKTLTDKYDFLIDELWETLSEYSHDDYIWTLDYQGITFWFNPFEIAAGRHGLLSAKLYFDENPYIFKKEYTTAPCEAYAVALPLGHAIDFDLDLTDNKKDCIVIETKADDYGSYNMLSVTVNGKTFIDEINYAYDFDVYLAHIGNKNYIYSDSWSDNDYHLLNTWDINGATPKIVQELYNTKFSDLFIEEGIDEGTVYTEAFMNPTSFKLEKRVEILGTREIWANFKINETDGTPQITDDDYTFNEGHEVVLKIPMAVQVVPHMDKHELGEGMHLTPCWTDGETYVDLMTEDGWTVRFEIDISNWPRTVNGIPEDECFEELFYAG